MKVEKMERNIEIPKLFRLHEKVLLWFNHVGGEGGRQDDNTCSGSCVIGTSLSIITNGDRQPRN